jgi:hypothetical protein
MLHYLSSKVKLDAGSQIPAKQYCAAIRTECAASPDTTAVTTLYAKPTTN